MLGFGALVLSFLLTYFVYRTILGRTQPPAEEVQIVVAAKKLSLGMRLTEEDLRVAAWPKSVPLEGGYSDVKQVVGRGVVTTIFPNEPILDAKLAPKEAGAGLTPMIPDGMRAMSVRVNDVVGVAGFVLPGTKVDIIIAGTPKGSDEESAKIALENVQVLTAGQNIEQDANGKPQNVPVVTLLVTPEQAAQLALAQTDRVQLALRNPLDTEHKNPAAVRRSSLFTGGQPAPAPPKPAGTGPAKAAPRPAPVVAAPPPPPPERKVEVFLGSKRDTVLFPNKK